MTEIFAIPLIQENAFQHYIERLSALLPESGKKQVFKYKQMDDLQRSLLGEALARSVLSIKTQISPQMVEINRTEKGKPFIQGSNNLYFNISHSGNWVVLAVSDQEIGIDVEKIREPHYRIAKRYFSAGEVKTLNTLEGSEKMSYFFDLWTLKESYLKMLGKGLTKSLGSFTLTKIENTFYLELDGRTDPDIHFYQPDFQKDYKISICALSCEPIKGIHMYTIDKLIEQGGKHG